MCQQAQVKKFTLAEDRERKAHLNQPNLPKGQFRESILWRNRPVGIPPIRLAEQSQSAKRKTTGRCYNAANRVRREQARLDSVHSPPIRSAIVRRAAKKPRLLAKPGFPSEASKSRRCDNNPAQNRPFDGRNSANAQATNHGSTEFLVHADDIQREPIPRRCQTATKLMRAALKDGVGRTLNLGQSAENLST